MTAPRWRDEAQRRGIVITVTQDLEALPPVEGNAFELRDALMRLILNAVAAMPEGGTLAIRATSEESGWVVVEVRDTGVGMPHDVQRRIAERARSLRPGARGEPRPRSTSPTSWSATAARSPSRARRARARRCGCACTRAASRSSPPPAGRRSERPSRAAVRVLLVDDDPRLVAVLSDMLRAEGHAVTTATNGEEAIELFDPAVHDVVITDLGMPRMTGWEVAERIKSKLARDRRVPAHRLGRERVGPRVEPVRRPRDRQARLGRVAARAARRAEAAPASRPRDARPAPRPPPPCCSCAPGARAARGLHDPPPEEHALPRRLLRLSRRQGGPRRRAPADASRAAAASRREAAARARSRRRRRPAARVLGLRRARAPRGGRASCSPRDEDGGAVDARDRAVARARRGACGGR